MDLKIRILRLNLLEWMVWGRFGGIVAATMNTRRLKISYKKKRPLFHITAVSESWKMEQMAEQTWTGRSRCDMGIGRYASPVNTG